MRDADELLAVEPPWWYGLEELLETLRPRLERLVYRYGIPPEDAPDLLQETLLVLCYKRHRVEDPEAWIVGTLRNRCRMYWRARRSKTGDLRYVVSSDLVATLAETGYLEARLGRQLDPGDPGLRRDLSRALARLPEPWAEVVRLRLVAGCNDDETARASPYQASSVRKILRRACRRLGELLAGEGGYSTPPLHGNGTRRRPRSEPREALAAVLAMDEGASPSPPTAGSAKRTPRRQRDRPADPARRLAALERRQVALAGELARVIAALRRPSRGVAS